MSIAKRFRALIQGMARSAGAELKAEITLSDGSPVTADHRELKANGQQKGYVVLSDEERAKGFVRPVRRSYVHVGVPTPKYPVRDLTPEEREEFKESGYTKYMAYPESERPKIGRYFTDRELTGCGGLTTMSRPIAETYARDPKFYGGTFCCHCMTHSPVGENGEFVWAGTNERVGT